MARSLSSTRSNELAAGMDGAGGGVLGAERGTAALLDGKDEDDGGAGATSDPRAAPQPSTTTSRARPNVEVPAHNARTLVG